MSQFLALVLMQDGHIGLLEGKGAPSDCPNLLGVRALHTMSYNVAATCQCHKALCDLRLKWRWTPLYLRVNGQCEMIYEKGLSH